jgi:SAM-dependent methyltransferase
MAHRRKTTCPACGSSRIEEFYRFRHLTGHPQFVAYQHAEGRLTEDGEAEPFMICADCRGLFRRDSIDWTSVFDNYHVRLASEAKDDVLAAIDKEKTRIDSVANDRLTEGLALLRQHVFPATNGRRPAILEVGCREGALARALKEGGADVSVIDPTKAYVDVLVEECGLHGVCGLFEKGSFPDGTFDAIGATEVLHRVDDVPGFVAAARDQLGPSGFLLLGVNNAYCPRWNYLTQQHRFLFTPASLTALLARHGFQVVSLDDHAGGPAFGYTLCLARKTTSPSVASLNDDPERLLTGLRRAEFGAFPPYVRESSDRPVLALLATLSPLFGNSGGRILGKGLRGLRRLLP